MFRYVFISLIYSHPETRPSIQDLKADPFLLDFCPYSFPYKEFIDEAMEKKKKAVVVQKVSEEDSDLSYTESESEETEESE
jgi:hypothetical protein